jgi:glycosyltransferase involved in cell wall biosynthesis
MKILQLNGYLSGGGVERYLARLFPALHARHIENVLIYGEPDGKASRLEAVTLHYIEGITRIFCEDQKEKLCRVREIIEQERPDVICLHQVANAPLVKLVTSGWPTVKFVHDFKMVCPDGKKTLKTRGVTCELPMGYRCQFNAYCHRCMPRNPFIGMPLIRNCVLIASLHKKRSQLVVASHFMKDVLRYNEFPAERIHVIPYFTPLPRLNGERVSSEPPNILALGRITREKGFDCLLHAYHLIQNKALLTIVGDGPELPALKRIAAELGLSQRVSFPGWLTQENLDAVYRQSSLVVVPSMWPEPFGMVGIEAMAYQKPVIAFDVGGICEWLKDPQTGFLVKPGDTNELCEKIKLLIESPLLSTTMGCQGRMMIKNSFMPEKHGESLSNLFQEAVKDRTVTLRSALRPRRGIRGQG